MFDHNMKEARVGEVDIGDVDPDTLKLMLEFIYTGEVPFTHLLRKLLKVFIFNSLGMENTVQSFSMLLTNISFENW